jgi:hypothetical protein
MEVDNLTTGDRVIGVSALLLLAFSFLDWLGEKATGLADVDPSNSASKNAWAYPVTMIAVVIGCVMLISVVLKMLDANQPTAIGPLSWNQVLFLAGLVAFLLIAIKLIVGPGSWTDAGGHRLSFDLLSKLCRGLTPGCEGVVKTRGIGIILGVIAGAGLAVGGYLGVKEDHSAPQPTPRARAATA